MDRELLDQELVSYFNQEFVSVKIDMNSPWGRAIKDKYELVFLPTLMILDPSGDVRYKVDKVVPAADLLDKARIVREQNVTLSDASSVRFSPVPQATPPTPRSVLSTQTPPTPTRRPVPNPEEDIPEPIDISDIKTDGDEKILYIMGDEGTVPPAILRHEAYHRYSLADGSHHKAALNYLNTQIDWTTPENIRFIFDFLHNARGPIFDFFVAERERFEEVIEPQQVAVAMHTLVRDRLDRGYPRPDLKESIRLYELIRPEQPIREAYQYQLEQLAEEQYISEYLSLAEHYLDSIYADDVEVIHQATQLYIVSQDTLSYDRARLSTWVERSVDLEPLDPRHLLDRAYLHYLGGDIATAQEALATARSLADKEGIALIGQAEMIRRIDTARP